MKENRIYQTFSILGFLKLWIGRGLIISFIAGAALHFEENPNGLSIFISLLLILLGIIWGETAEVYPDRFVYKRHYALGLLTRARTYHYKDVKFIGYEGFFTEISDIIEDVLIDSLFSYDIPNHIEIINKAGKTKRWRTFIYKSQLKKAFKKMYQQKEYMKQTAANSSRKG